MSDGNDFVSLEGGELLTDSRRVAAHFDKLHKNVLRSFDELDCLEKFNRLNFEPVDYIDKNGETQREVLMTTSNVPPNLTG